MNKRIYLVSLYYDRNRVTGANKRFDEIGQHIFATKQWDSRVIVTRGNKPHWCPEEQVDYVRPYGGRLSRMLSWLHLSWVLWRSPSAVVYSDFQPAPIGCDLRHKRFQLIHDLRNWTGFGRGGLGALTQSFQSRQLRTAFGVVTVSHASAQDIVAKCAVPAHQVVVSYNGIQPRYLAAKSSQADRGSEPEEKATGKTTDLLYIATFEKRKNHLVLLQALELVRGSLKVVLLGRDLGTRTMLQDYVKRSTRLANKSIEFIEAIDEERLIDLYRDARVFISPSLFEGFGMPLLEARACGVAVACSNIDVFREIMGEGALYFDPINPQDIAESIERALASDTSGAADLESFGWDRITQKLLVDIEKLCAPTAERKSVQSAWQSINEKP